MSSCRRLPHHLGHLALQIFTRQCLLGYVSLLICSLKHIPRGRIQFSAIVRIGIVPIAHETAVVIEIIAPHGLVFIDFIFVFMVERRSPADKWCLHRKCSQTQYLHLQLPKERDMAHKGCQHFPDIHLAWLRLQLHVDSCASAC